MAVSAKAKPVPADEGASALPARARVRPVSYGQRGGGDGALPGEVALALRPARLRPCRGGAAWQRSDFAATHCEPQLRSPAGYV